MERLTLGIAPEGASDLSRGFQAREHVDEAEEGDAQRLVLERPVDHPPHPVLGPKEGRFMLRRPAVKRPGEGADLSVQFFLDFHQVYHNTFLGDP